MKRSNYFLPEGLKKGLHELAERKNVSEATLVRQAVESMLKRNKVEYEETEEDQPNPRSNRRSAYAMAA